MTNKIHFCTIITPDYIDYVKVQYEFIKEFNKDVEIHVLVSTTDIAEIQTPQYKNLPDSIKCFTLKDVCKEGVGKEIFDKYYYTYIDGFRWSMKPVFLNYLFKKNISDKIIYTDWDIIFFNDYNFLFDDLDNYDVLLTPQWWAMSPFETNNEEDVRYFESNFNFGLFNAGFIGANKDASILLEWWAKICLYVCEQNGEKGFFVDQSHLNLFPFLSEKVGIVRHKGCNLSFWNRTECKRIKRENEILINGEFPIVFIHFTNIFTNDLLSGKDELLRPYFESYVKKYKEVTNQTLPAINRYNRQIELDIYNRKPLMKLKKKLVSVKEKIRIRTRFKKFLKG